MLASAARADRALLLILGAAALGIAVSAYLTAAHYAEAELACVQSALVDCEAVTTSSYSLVPGTAVPIALVGLLWFGVSGAAAVIALRADPSWLRLVHLAWAAAGVGVALYLIDAEIRVIGRICEWCTALHLLIGLTFFLALRRVVPAAE